MTNKLDKSVVFLSNAIVFLGPSDVVEFEELKSEFSMQANILGTTQGAGQLWLEQSLDGVNFTRLTDNATGAVFNISVVWGSGNPLDVSSLRHFPSGNVLAKIFRANWIITSGSDPSVAVTAILAAR